MFKDISTSELIEKSTKLILLVAVIFLLLLYLWGLNKGFDITDEGYCLLGFQSLQEKLGVVSSFHVIIEKLFGWMNPNIITYRLIALVITLISSVVFALSFWQWFSKFYGLKNVSFDRNSVLLIFIFGSFLLDYYLYRSVSYNTLNNFTNLLQASLVFFTISQEKEIEIKSIKFKISWLSVGFLLAFQFLVKPPSAVIFFALLSLVLLLYKQKINWQYYFRVYCYLLLGTFLGFLVYFLFFQDFNSYLTLIIRNLSKSNTTSHSSVSLLDNYFGDFIKLLQRFYEFLWLYFTVFLLSLIYSSSQYLQVKKYRYLLGFLTFLLVSNALYQLYKLNLFPPKNIYFLSTYFLMFMLFLLVILIGVWWGKLEFNFSQLSQKKLWQSVAISMFLFGLPFAASMGTNTGLFNLAARNGVPWLALIILLLNNIDKEGKAKALIWLFILGLILSLLIGITHRYVYKPYRIPQNLLAQTETIDLDLPSLNSLKVDKKTKLFLEKLNELMNQANFKPGEPMVALYDMPGLVYIFGGLSPGNPWYFGPPAESVVRNCSSISNSNMNKSESVILINYKLDKIDQNLLNCLQTSGVDFPAHYQKVGEVYNPYYDYYRKYYSKITPHLEKVVSVWSPKS